MNNNNNKDFKNICLTKEQSYLYNRIYNNSSVCNCEKWDNNYIKFIVLEYIGDDIPKQHICKNINDMIVLAYRLKLVNRLHCILIEDKNGYTTSTDALNLFDDTTLLELRKEIEEQKKEIELYKKFLIKNNASNLFEQFKKDNE